LRPTKILLLDDDAALRQALTFSLEIEGYEVMSFADGPSLLAGGAGHTADCLVFDYKLQAMNGLDVLETLRNEQVAAPAILITSHPKPAVRHRAAELGAAVVEKPLLGDFLAAKIREIAIA
jgi:DNA-binding response OmpR family regulator